MHASSRAALVLSRERASELTAGVDGDGLLGVADELFAVAHLLDSQMSLRRALSDASVRPDDRAGLARRLLGAQISATALDVVEEVARQRWSRPLDLVEAVETLATDAALDADLLATSSRERGTAVRDAFVTGWRGACSEAVVREALRLAAVVNPAYQAVSFAGIAQAVEDRARADNPWVTTQLLRRLIQRYADRSG